MAGNTYAHHSSGPHFDPTIDITLEAVVTDWKLVNPHAYVYFDVTEDDGSTTNWRCESSAASSLRKRGYTDETFVPGQKLTINGNPARREDNVCFLSSFAFADGTTIGRNGDIPVDNSAENLAVAEKSNDEQRPKYLANSQPNISGFWVRERRGGPPGGPGGPGAGAARPGNPGGAGGPRGPNIDMNETGLAAQAKYEQIYDDPSIHCDIANIFFGWGHDGHVNSITQQEDTVTMLYGYMDYVRTIHLDMSEHPDNVVPSTGGHSIGRWEGDVLVVDSVGFNAGVLHPLSGASHSDQMRTTERIWYDEDSETLERSYVAEDPLYLNSPYTGQDSQAISAVPYVPYECTELSGDNNKRPEDRA